MSNQDRLQEQLRSGLGKRIYLRLRNRHFELSGILRQYDPHLNLLMEDVQEIPIGAKDKNSGPRYNKIVIRGDSIVLISF